MVPNSSVSSHAPPPTPPSSTSPPSPQQGSKWSGERLLTIGILAILGVAFGLGLFTFSYAKGFSYLSNDPAACVNCHVMRDQFDGWTHSSHKAVATCNDCHTPHRFPDKWVIKGVNGWNHSVAFTTGNFPDPIMIRGFNARIAQENCVDCHATTVAQMHLYISPEEPDCVACHGNVGHANEAPVIPGAVPIWYGPGTARTILDEAASSAQSGQVPAASEEGSEEKAGNE